MARFLDYLSDARFGFGGIGVFVAFALLVALYWVMPRGGRRNVRVPAALLFLHLCVVALREGLPLAPEGRRAFEVTALFLLLACVGRASFVLVIDGLLDHRLHRPLPRIVREIVQLLVYFGVAFVTLRAMGAELGSLLTTSALLTAVVGLSLQDTLGNVFAGLAIQAQRPFKVGDWIQVDGTADSSIGRVIEINWRATKILTNDRVEIVVPNGLLAKSALKNFTQPTAASRRIVTVQGPYEQPPHVVEAALLEATRGCPGVLEHPKPATWVSLYADSGIEYSVVFFIDNFAKHRVIDSEVRRRLWYALQRVGVSIPFPVRDVRIQQQSEASLRAAETERSRDIVRMLRSVDFLDTLPENALERLAHGAQSRLYSAGEDIIRQGEEGDELFVIRSGAAVVLLEREGQQVAEVAHLRAGNVVGEMSLATGDLRSATVRATSACECVVVGHDAFRDVLASNPDLAVRVSEVLATRRAEMDSTRLASAAYDRASESNLLLSRIKSFFSLWPPDKADADDDK